jgi:hypothetical protein
MSIIRTNPRVLLIVAAVLVYSASSNALLLIQNEQLTYDLTACEALKMELAK